MKKLWLKILIFMAPLILMFGFLPVDKRLNYVELKDDCFYHGIWLYDRIHNNPAPVDIVFLGSSHTVNSINDTLIEKICGDTTLHVVNMGYCRYGVNLYYAFLKELMKKKSPEIVFIEVREDENIYSHPIFPYVADPGDVFCESPFFNQDLFSDYVSFYEYRIKLVKAQYVKMETVEPVRTDNHGFAASADTAQESFLKGIKDKSRAKGTSRANFFRKMEMVFPGHYLDKIATLCRNSGVKLVFLYIPQYGSPWLPPREMETYTKLGGVLIPPAEIFADSDNWFDENHLNQAGANKLSAWIAMKVKEGL